MFTVFEHTADVGLRIQAESFDALLRDAARGLFSLIVANLEEVRGVEQRSWTLSADAADYLLFDWLNELLYCFDTDGLVFVEYEIATHGCQLQALARGERVDPVRHVTEHEVKAITYHGLSVTQRADHWAAEVIVDI